MVCKNKILIVGKIPPPIGGVTIHVKRLLEHAELETKNLIDFLDLQRTGKIAALKTVFRYRIIHLHTSSVYFRFFFSLFCRITLKKLLITVHGNLGRFKFTKNIFDYISILICYIPILINENSFNVSKKLNKKSLIIPAFIPPLKTDPLNKDLLSKIDKLNKEFGYIFCTNAYGLTWDKNGDEIYGILQLLEIFEFLKDRALIFSDPSGDYFKYFKKNGIVIPANVLLISYAHDFFEVLKLSDVFIRNTTTDGDSLSIKEAIYLKKDVFATDYIDRPQGCIVYSKANTANLRTIIEGYTHLPENKHFDVESAIPYLSELYARLLKSYSCTIHTDLNHRDIS